jgi:hypothetical protein
MSFDETTKYSIELNSGILSCPYWYSFEFIARP